MLTTRAHRSSTSGVTSIVPGVAGWRTYPRALANLLLFGMVALSGEWLVHQIEYLIEYGHRFERVMAATPHHYYMAPLGSLLATAGALTLVVSCLLLVRADRVTRHLLAGVPHRLSRHAPTLGHDSSLSLLGQTAICMTALQTFLYLIQENIESAAMALGLPGLWVLFAPQHITVLPLHLLVAGCGALLLRTLAAHFQHSRHAVRIARVLAAITAPSIRAMPRSRNVWRHLPSQRLAAGVLGLRSPPLGI